MSHGVQLSPGLLDTEELIDRLLANNEQYRDELENVRQQHESLRVALNIALRSKDDEIERLKQKHEEDDASYRQLIEEAVDAALEECNHDWRVRLTLIEDENKYLQSIASDLKQRLKAEVQTQSSPEDVECSKLKCLVTQMEQEIKSLKTQLENSERRLASASLNASLERSQSNLEEGLKSMPLMEGGKSTTEIVDYHEQLVCLKTQVSLEREKRATAEDKLADVALKEMSESTSRQMQMDNMDTQISSLELELKNLCMLTEAKLNQAHTTSIEISPNEHVNGQSGTAFVTDVQTPKDFEHSLPQSMTLQSFSSFDEDLLLMRTIDSDYQRLLERNQRLEIECKDLRKQLEVNQQATARAISAIRSEMDRTPSTP